MAVLDAFDHNFDALINTEYAVVDFYGDNCGACVMLSPIFEATANEMPFIRFVHINVTHNRGIAERYNIHAVPALFFYRNGEIVYRELGAVPRKKLNQDIAVMLYQ